MKRIFLLISLTIVTFSSFSQTLSPRVRYETRMEVPDQNAGLKTMTIDTLLQYFYRSSYYALYYLDGGYVFGPGVFVYSGVPYPVSTATGCHYDGVGNAKVTDVLLFCGAKQIVGNADSIHINVYNVALDTTPTNLLGSQSILTSELDTFGFWTVISNMNTDITSSFLVTVEYGGIDDTFGLRSNGADLSLHGGYGDGLGEGRSRLRTTPDFGGKWMGANDLYLDSMDADVFIIPVVDITDGMKEFKNELFSLKPVSPVPSTGIISLDYTLTKPSTVSYSIMDMTGKIILKSAPEIKTAAEYKEIINMTSFAAGKYFVTFRAGTKSLTQQMIIVK